MATPDAHSGTRPCRCSRPRSRRAVVSHIRGMMFWRGEQCPFAFRHAHPDEAATEPTVALIADCLR